jgi:hypothetical protein
MFITISQNVVLTSAKARGRQNYYASYKTISKNKIAPQSTRRRTRTKSRPVPETMRAVAINRYGGPEVLTVHELPVPELAPNEVLIAIHTAGVGGWDADIRDGWNPGARIELPFVLGTDGSGTIAQLGS